MLDDIKKTLWASADKLRANMDAAEYKHLVLGLIFVKYISDTFAARRAELTARLTNPDDEYFYGDADPADIEAELEDRDYYKEVNVFWVPEGARWEQLRNAAKQPDIGKRIDDALSSAAYAYRASGQASSQASATCAGVAPRAAAIVVMRSTSAWLSVSARSTKAT